jgi:hypothetical protein
LETAVPPHQDSAASTSNSPVRRLVRNHRDFRVAIEHARFSTPDGGYINGSTVVVRRERSAVTERITPAR